MDRASRGRPLARVAGWVLLAALVLSGGIPGLQPGLAGVGQAQAAEAEEAPKSKVPIVSADEFLQWLEGKELAFLELYNPG